MIANLLVLAMAAAPPDPCELPTGRDANPCAARVGHCFDLEIAGQRTERFGPSDTRDSLRKAIGYDVCWVLRDRTPGVDKVRALANARTPALGESRSPLELVVYGLEGQQIPTTKGIRTDPTVRIGGVEMQTVVDVIDTANLPDGAYAVKVRYVGTENWDQQVVLLWVERAGAKAKPAE
ncbi:MAG TPA: hypothetical protein VND91_11715 [Candidatus Saccharimonadia bacterium]|nr:hypothetical protein [Candidatus Saccharimonadia bacterium]